MKLWANFVGSVQSVAANSGLMSRFAVKLKGQCDTIIGRRLSSGIDLASNGEGWLIERIAPTASMFVDVGANVGAWTVNFAKLMRDPHGILFEPAPATVERLRKTVLAAKLPNLEIVAAAVGDFVGSATFAAENEFGETSSLVPGHSQRSASAVTVPVVTLDQALDERGIKVVDMLKIDAEGFDLRVLQGAGNFLSRQAIKVVQFEYNSPWARAGSTLAAAYGLLEGHGYTVRVLRRDGLWRLDPALTGEFYRYANFIAWCPSRFAAGLDGEHPACF